jgi:peptidoglycan LD-endopeptidase CwlK
VSAKIELLRADVQVRLRQAIEEMDRCGTRYAIVSTLRTKEEQQALYAQGRLPLSEVNRFRHVAGMPDIPEQENKYTVTNCDGVKFKSNHQGGNAVDVVPADSRGRPYWPAPGAQAWVPIVQTMKKYGFEAGADWVKFPDWPHFEIKG